MDFKYDKEKEIDIFRRMASDGRFNPGTTKLWEREFEKVSFEEGCEFLDKQVKVCEENWKEVEENYLEQMSKFFEKKCEIPAEMTCYLVRFTTFPYSIEHGWFMAPLYGSPSDRNRIIMHELCHFFTPRGVDNTFKEALPVIINDSETFRMYSVDRGNKSNVEEMEMRKKIMEMFKTGKTYSEVVKGLSDKL